MSSLAPKSNVKLLPYMTINKGVWSPGSYCIFYKTTTRWNWSKSPKSSELSYSSDPTRISPTVPPIYNKDNSDERKAGWFNTLIVK